MKIASQQVWKHKTDDKISLVVIDGVNKNYKVKIIGPRANMHMIETVSQKYITGHFYYVSSEKKKDKLEVHS